MYKSIYNQKGKNMSNYNSLKTIIDANIKPNGNQEITGQILNSVLKQMVNILGAGYQFAGVATLDPATNPGTPDAKVFYVANGKGTYTNFGGIEVTEDEVVILYYDTAWHKVATGIASQEKLTELDSQIEAEATARTEADAALQTQINGKQDNIDSFSADEKAAFLVSLGLGKIGVISQKQTWNAVGVEPSYVMSEQVSGFISQDNIGRLISYGFVFNEETGFFELNGLTDISLQEALDIVAAGKPNPTLCDIHYAYKKIRTNLPILDNQMYNRGYFGSGISNQIRMGGMALESNIEVFVYGQYKQNDNYINSGFMFSTTAQGGGAFSECQKLEKISIIPGTATRFYNTFKNCLRLKELELVYLLCDVDLSNSSLLSAKSIHIMIANADNKKAITITLHSDAKARWEASEYYAEDSQTIVTKNITIA